MSDFAHLQSPQDSSPEQRAARLHAPHWWQPRWPRLLATATLGVSTLTALTWGVPSAGAATTNVNLGVASTYAVLAGSSITNTGASVISGDIGISPGTSITGFPPGVQSSGVTHVTDGSALSAQAGVTAAYLDAASRTPFTTVSGDLGGTTLVAGVYASSSSLSLTGTLTLNGGGNADSVFIFQAGSSLLGATSSRVVLENGAQACHVFWQVGSSVTLGTTSSFVGSIMALTSITLDTGASVSGQVLARNGAVTLDNNVISVPTCAAASVVTTTSSTTTTVAPTTTTTVAPTTTTTVAPTTTTTVAPTTTTTVAPTTTTTVAPVIAPAPTSTTTTTAVIPSGPPATGEGGAAPSSGLPRTPLAIALAILSAILGGLAVTARRRRRHGPDGGSHDHTTSA